MRIYSKVSIGLAILFIIVTGLLLRSQYAEIKMAVYEKREADIIKYVNDHALSFGLSPAFDEEDIVRQQQIFGEFFGIIQTPEIFRVKVFNRTPKIVWSNLTEIIGDDASQNQDALNALEGISRMKFKSSKPEQLSERQYPEFTETYMPVKNIEGDISGVFEVYQTVFVPNQQIKESFQKAAINTILIAVIAYLVIVLLLRFVIKPKS